MLANMMFDTKLPPGVVMATPFGDDTVLNDISVKVLSRFTLIILIFIFGRKEIVLICV